MVGDSLLLGKSPWTAKVIHAWLGAKSTHGWGPKHAWLGAKARMVGGQKIHKTLNLQVIFTHPVFLYSLYLFPVVSSRWLWICRLMDNPVDCPQDLDNASRCPHTHEPLQQQKDFLIFKRRKKDKGPDGCLPRRKNLCLNSE
jgi:hypothetical protein